MPPPLPRCSRWAYSSLNLAHPYQPSPKPLSGWPAHRPFEDCSAFTRVAACTLARSPNRDRYPKASDTSSPPCLLRLLPAGANSRGRGLHPLEKRRLVTAHAEARPSPNESFRSRARNGVQSSGVQINRRNRSRIPTRSILRWLVERKSAPLQTKSTPAALASCVRCRTNAEWSPRLRNAGSVAESAR